MKWIKANEKPDKLLETYYCKVYRDEIKQGWKKTVLITLDGVWSTDDTVIEWLDESESPSGANVLVEGLREIASLYNTPVKDVLSPTDMVIKMGEIAQAALAQYNAVEPEKKKERDIIKSVIHHVLAESEGEGYWQTCTGCHESEDGHDVGEYYYSETFKCKLGGGCHECGGIGAIWEYHPEESQSPPTPIDREPEGIDETYIRKFLIDNRVIRTELQDQCTELLLLFYNHITRK